VNDETPPAQEVAMETPAQDRNETTQAGGEVASVDAAEDEDEDEVEAGAVDPQSSGELSDAILLHQPASQLVFVLHLIIMNQVHTGMWGHLL
jgi:hypothetical protein